MLYSKAFKDALELDIYIGTGNPNSKVLIIGKEVATDTESLATLELNNSRNHSNNVKLWLNNIQNGTKQDDIKKWNKESQDNNPLYAFKGDTDILKKSGHTWTKYQKLYNYVFSIENNRKIDFQERFFIAEMNENPSKRTSDAQKKSDFKLNLQIRKKALLNTKFIQDFPVVVLACSDYINGNEICSYFNVDYIEEKGSGRQRFWIHRNTDNSKLVIHTRQLSANVSNELLSGMAEEIRSQLNLTN